MRTLIFVFLITGLVTPTHASSGQASPPIVTAKDCVERGILSYGTMDYQNALFYFQKAGELKPSRTYKKFIAYCMQVLEDYSVALREIEELHIQFNEAPLEDKDSYIKKLKVCHLRMGKLLLNEGGYIAIIKTHFEYIIAYDPINVEARRYLGDLHYSAMLYEQAIENYQKALKIDSENPFFQQRLADIYVGVGRYDEARSHYEETIRLLEQFRLDDKTDEISYLKKLIGKLPTAIQDIQELLDKKQYKEVISLCKKRTSMNPGDITAITCMGIAYEALGQWKKAQRLYQTAVKRAPDYPTPYYYLGNIYLVKRKDYKKAIAYIKDFKTKSQELLEIDKNAKASLITALHNLVYIYHEITREYRKAVQEGTYLVKLAPRDQRAHYNLALSYAYLDKKSMAYSAFKKVIEINPDTKIAFNARDMIERMQKYSSIKTLPYQRWDE